MAGVGWELLRGAPSPLQEFCSMEQIVPTSVVMCSLFANACFKLDVSRACCPPDLLLFLLVFQDLSQHPGPVSAGAV